MWALNNTGVRGSDPLSSWKSTYKFHLAFRIHGFPTSEINFIDKFYLMHYIKNIINEM